MRVSGHDVLSERTERSSRFVLAVAATIILVKWYKVEIGDLTFLGVNLPADLFETAASIMLIYAIVNFLQHWIFDVYAWSEWYAENVIDSWDGRMTMGQFVSGNMENFGRNFTDQETDSGRESVLKSVAKFITESVPSHNRRLGCINWMGRLYIFGQHLALPLLASVWALMSIWVY